MVHLQQRQQLVECARLMNSSGINQGTAGNISVRIPGGLLITPSSMPYEQMEPDDLVPLSFSGDYPSGSRRPSSEWRLHADLLSRRSDCEAVVHCHSVHATALACHGLGIPSFHYMVVMAGGTSINCAPYATFGTQELSDLALTALADRRACLMANHGQVALGASLDQALRLAIEVETLARMYLQARLLGEPTLLTAQQMAAVQLQMAGLHYGQPERQGISTAG
jgi:L-fuculose-phosphate aldolase